METLGMAILAVMTDTIIVLSVIIHSDRCCIHSTFKSSLNIRYIEVFVIILFDRYIVIISMSVHYW